MLEKLQSDLKAAAETVGNSGITFFGRIRSIEDAGGSRFDEKIVVPATGLSLQNSRSRLESLINFMLAISSTNVEQLALVSQSVLKQILSDLTRVHELYRDVLTTLESWESEQSPITSLDLSNFHISSANGTIDLGLNLSQIESHIDGLLDRAYRVPIISEKLAFETFASLTQRLSLAHVEAEKSRISAASSEQAAKASANTAQEFSNAAAEAAETTAKELSAVQSHSDKAEEIHTALEEQLTFIDQVSTRAQAVKDAVDEYDTEFSAFDKKLSERNRAFADGGEKLSQLTGTLEAKDKEAIQIIQNARIALAWATADGLASGFSASAKELDKPLQEAQLKANRSFLILAVWGVVLFVIIPEYFPNFRILNSLNDRDPLASSISLLSGALVRLALLAPAILYTFFSISNYRQIYIAREQYIFKKTIAASLPGFKQEADVDTNSEIVKGMTAAAYERLLFNPREAISRDLAGSERMGFLSRWLVKLMQAAFEKAKPKA